MKRNINRLMPILLAGIFMCSGCAKQDIVKKDDSLASSALKPAETAQSKPDAGNGIQDPSLAGTAAKVSPLEGGEAARSQQNNEVTAVADLQKLLQQIFFDFDASTLSDSARQTLTANFQLLKQNPQTILRIEGHSDERGSDDYNLALSERRAQAAYRYLTALGIAAERLSVVGYGKEKPADQGHDEAAWANNRRDEFVVMR